MKSEIGKEYNVDTMKQPCNEWCCPCNEGDGCHANEKCEVWCENDFFADGKSMFSQLLDRAYHSMNNKEGYEEICKEFFEYAERHL